MNTATIRTTEPRVLVLLLAVFTLFGCKDNSGGTDPEPPPPSETVQKTITAADSETDEAVAPFAILSDGDTLATSVDSYETEAAPKGETRSYTVVADGYAEATRTITFSDGSPETFRLERVAAKTAEIAVRLLLDGSGYDGATVFADATDEELVQLPLNSVNIIKICLSYDQKPWLINQTRHR